MWLFKGPNFAYGIVNVQWYDIYLWRGIQLKLYRRFTYIDYHKCLIIMNFRIHSQCNILNEHNLQINRLQILNDTF